MDTAIKIVAAVVVQKEASALAMGPIGGGSTAAKEPLAEWLNGAMGA